MPKRYFGLPGTEADAQRILAVHGSTEGTGGTPQSKPPTWEALKTDGLVTLLEREIATRNRLVAALRDIRRMANATGYEKSATKEDMRGRLQQLGSFAGALLAEIDKGE